MIKQDIIQINDFVFDLRVLGVQNDPMVVLLHGFPETSFMWINLIKDIAPQGFYCVAPNLRGYSKNAVPKGKKHYTIDKLCQDVIGIAAALGKNKFHLVGHDWGAAIGWYLVHEHPEKILSWTALSVPHISAFSKAITTDADQIKKSRYIKNFQIPYLPEMRIRKKDFELFRKLWKHSSTEEIEDYLSVFKNKKSLTAALNYYRANYKVFLKHSIGDIWVPTLLIWGQYDLAIGATSVENGHQYMRKYYKFVKLDAGHWLIQTQFEQLKEEISAHLLKFE